MSTKNTAAVQPQLSPPAQPAEPRSGLVEKFARQLGVESGKLLTTLKATAFKQRRAKDGSAGAEVTNEQMMALLVVANEYGLNPFTREIYAFPSSEGGGIVPIVSVDGWTRIINERPELVSIEFAYAPDDAENPWTECTITRRDRSVPLTVREYLKECYRDTGPWNSHPRRMLRHKALIQCARVAFGYGGIYDPDEADHIRDAMAIEGTATEVRGKPHTQEPQQLTQQAPVSVEQSAAQAQSVPVHSKPDMVSEVRRLIDTTGVPERDVLKRFGSGGFAEPAVRIEDMAEDQLAAAVAWFAKLT